MAKILTSLTFISEKKVLELYPPFLFMGVRILRVSKDFLEMDAKLPFRWYTANLNGTMFGGSMCSLSDPLHALLCGKIFAPLETWTKANHVEFLRPAHGDLTYEVRISADDVEKMKTDLDSNGRTTHSFEAYFYDKERRQIAKVNNTVYLKKKIKS